MNDLTKKKCQACEGGIPKLSSDQAHEFLKGLPGWEMAADHLGITRVYRFNNFYETMAFVNALAFIAHQEDHHPNLSVGYSQCRVDYSTHAVNGLTENDFICAAKINALVLTSA